MGSVGILLMRFGLRSRPSNGYLPIKIAANCVMVYKVLVFCFGSSNGYWSETQ